MERKMVLLETISFNISSLPLNNFYPECLIMIRGDLTPRISELPHFSTL